MLENLFIEIFLPANWVQWATKLLCILSMCTWFYSH